MQERSNLAKALGINDWDIFTCGGTSQYIIKLISDTFVVCRLNANKSIEPLAINQWVLCDMIQYPEKITVIKPAPKYTPEEMKYAEALIMLGFKYIARSYNESAVYAYGLEPIFDHYAQAYYRAKQDYDMMSIFAYKFPSIKPGEYIKLSDMEVQNDEQ